MIDVDVHTSYDSAGKFVFECPECGALVEIPNGDDRVECVDYDGMPIGCGTEWRVGTPTVEISERPE